MATEGKTEHIDMKDKLVTCLAAGIAVGIIVVLLSLVIVADFLDFWREFWWLIPTVIVIGGLGAFIRISLPKKKSH